VGQVHLRDAVADAQVGDWIKMTDDLVEKVADSIRGYFSGADKAYGEHRACVRTAIAAIEEAGWCLVPKEPTDDMIRASVFGQFNDRTHAQRYAEILSMRPRITGETT
jgi:hypothetical protein